MKQRMPRPEGKIRTGSIGSSAGSLVSKMLIWSILLTGMAGTSWAQHSLRGVVYDEYDHPLESATVHLEPGPYYQLSQAGGGFAFYDLAPGTYVVHLSMAGYEPDSQEVTLPLARTRPLHFHLRPLSLEAVEITEEHAKQEATLATLHLGAEALARDLRGTFVNSLGQLPGLDAINVGVGIAKPVIRGLSANRVVVNDLGVKQEGQQWGMDHGLELDPFGVERVEVIKGPASLQYGSDALGGAINLMPAPPPPAHSLQAEVQGLYKTNNQHLGTSALLAVNGDNRWVQARYSRQDFGDYRVPADSFVYQTFVLPIFDGYLKNTSGREESLHLGLGQRRDWGLSRLTFRQYALDAGIFPGAIGAPRAYALTPDGNRRDRDLPYQRVRHTKLIFNQLLFFGQHHLSLDLGYQRNQRQEHGFPEYHYQPNIDRTNTLALDLDLHTLSGDLHLEQLTRRGKWVLGASSQYQHNTVGGWEFLLPAYRSLRAGLYALGHWNAPGDRLLISGGLRADYGTNRSGFFQRYVWNSNAEVIDSLSVPLIDQQYESLSGSLGLNYAWVPGRLFLKANLGKSFRMPHPAELATNGVHHGTFRHEQGNPDLRSEHGYQLDLSLDWQGSRFSAQAAGFFNFFQNYIYLAPQAAFSPLPEAGQIFRYTQHDALYSGFEASWAWQLTPSWALKQALEYVWNLNLDTWLSLPFTPHPSARTELAWQKARAGGHWEDLYASLSSHVHLANGPNRVDRNERTTPGFHLLDLSLGATLHVGPHRITLRLQGQNLLNAYYLQHLSRYRLINVPEQGRNWVVSVRIPFQTGWDR